MDPVHTVRLKCSTCGQPGFVRWAHPAGGRAGPRRLVTITAGFSAVNRGALREPKLLCVTCTDAPTAAAEHPTRM